MAENNQEIMVELIKIVDQLLSGNKPLEIKPGVIDKSDDPLLDELAGKLTMLSNKYGESYQFIIDLSRGKLNTETSVRNLFVNPYKQLQSELRYLTWQINEIANGDYDQRVYFSGEFSYAINKMVMALRERQELANKLEESNATKDKLFSIIAHDLRNPFNTIMNSSELLLELIDLDSSRTDIRQCAEMISSSATHTYDLLMNLLEWSRLQTGRIIVNRQPLDLGLIILANIRIANLTAEPKNVTIHFDDKNSYPVNTDSTILNTILRNLIGNAIKYTNENGSIHITIGRDEKYYYISVRDNGMGMSEWNQQKLFRLDTVQSTPGTNKEEGTGLGLILCRDFVHLIGGEITVKSKLREGSVFTFSLPIVS